MSVSRAHLEPSLLQTVVIEHVSPELDAGRFPIKREVGDVLRVSADVFAEGHDALAAVVRWRRVGEAAWRETAMRLVDNDRWAGEFPLEDNARYEYTIAAWRDLFESWRRNVAKKFE